jgi:hypothetical protein
MVDWSPWPLKKAMGSFGSINCPPFGWPGPAREDRSSLDGQPFVPGGGAWTFIRSTSVRPRAFGSMRLRARDLGEIGALKKARFDGDRGVFEVEALPLPLAPLTPAALPDDLDPQPHLRERGRAAVTVAHAQPLFGGCGQMLSGRPGFRTGSITRSLAWLHFVERWPRMQGSLGLC